MRDALRLMAKVFAVVFGAGAAIVVLGYIALGGLYIYSRIEAPREQPTATQTTTATPDATTNEAIPLYDRKGFIPDVLPDAQLNCENKNGPWLKYSSKPPMCSVEIEGKVAAVISRQEVKDNLAGWMSVLESSHKGDPLDSLGTKATKSGSPPPCPSNDPLGLYVKSKCAPLPGK